MSLRIFIILLVGITACQPPNSPSDEEGKVPTDTESIASVSLVPAQLQTADIRLGTLQKQRMSEAIEARGFLDAPPQHRAVVSPIMAGYVKTTSLLVGDQVKKGQTLAVLSHPDYVALQQQYLEELKRLDYLKSAYERQLALGEDQINAKKNLIKATSDYEAAQARMEGLRQRLSMLGLPPKKIEQGTITSEIRLVSPLNGYITRVNSTIGKLVLPGEELFEIVNLDHLHVEMRVFEKDLPQIRIGQPFSFTLTGSSQRYSGKVYLIGKSLSHEDRTVQVHGHPDENHSFFLPGMYVNATIYTGSDSVWVLPEQAVVSANQQAFTFVKRSKGQFAKVLVQMGRVSQGWIEVTPSEELGPQDSVVIAGTYYLSAASERED